MDKTSNSLGCNFCSEEYEHYDPMNGIAYRGDEIILVMQTFTWDHYSDGPDTIEISVCFCPMCGKSLR